MLTVKPTQWLRCSQCEDYKHPSEIRLVVTDGPRSRDQDGRWLKPPPRETVSDDPAGEPYCGPCAESLGVGPKQV